MPTLASASSASWKASEAISRDTMNPMPAMVPTPVTAAQPTGGRILPRLIRARSHAAATVPRLAEDVAEQDPERDRRGEGLGQKCR